MNTPAERPSPRADRLMLCTIGLHALVAVLLGWLFDALWWSTAAVGALLAVAGLAYRLAATRLACRLLLAVVAMALVGVQLQLAQGQVEAHFGVFATLAFLLVYLDWRPIVLATALAALHHVVVDRLQLAGWPVYCLPAPNGIHILLHIACIAMQAAIECAIVVGMRQHLDKMAEASKVLVQTLEQATDGVIVIDEQNRVTLFNAAAERLWSRARAGVIGQNVKMLVPQAMQYAHDGFVDANRDTGVNRIVGTSREVPIVRANGTQLWGTMSISKVQLPGRILYTAFVRDVTHQRALLEHQRLLSTAVNESDSAVVVSGADRRIVFANAGCVRMFGYSPEELIGRLPTEILVGPHTDQRVLAEAREKAIAGDGYSIELLTYTKDRRPLWASIVVNPVLGPDGELRNFVGVLADITQTKMHEVLQYKVLDAMARETPMLDVMTLVCREVERIAPEVVATILAIDDGLVRTLAAPSLPEHFAQAMSGQAIGPRAGSCGTAAWRNEAVLSTDIANDPLWEAYGALALPLGLRACWASPIRSSDGHVLGTFAFYYREVREPSALHRRLVDVSLHLCALSLEREKAKAHIHQLAFYDSLTGLPNRAMLLSKAERVLHEARRTQAPLTVLFVDLDRFKQVNDTQGHMVGDELLKELARRLEAFARDTDVVGRLSGDEFVAVLPQCSATQAASAAERLTAAIAQPVEVLGVTLHPTASIGVALFPDDGTDVDTLIRHADMAMYQAKPQGRRRYQFFSAEMNRAAQERAMLEADLRAALADQGLALHYQPQLAHDGADLYGVEALLRWTHPLLGNVPPLRFVALAEECGLIRPLGAWVLAQACRQMADWRGRGVAVPQVSINLSASNFHEADLPQTIARALRDHGLDARDLIVEMTEGVMLSRDPVVLATIEAVHALGVRLSMDDFGTGYSSLSYLHRLPIDEIKLDKSFVQDIEHSAMARALTTSVLRIGKSLGMTVVAEGVETEAQRAFLVAGECAVLQGYLFSRPVAPAALEAWIAQRAAALPIETSA